MLTDGNVYQCQWTMAKVVAVYPGQDNIVRAVDVQVEMAVIPKDCKTRTQLAQQITTKTAVYRRPVSKLSMLLAADETPELQLMDQAQALNRLMYHERTFMAGEDVGSSASPQVYQDSKQNNMMYFLLTVELQELLS